MCENVNGTLRDILRMQEMSGKCLLKTATYSVRDKWDIFTLSRFAVTGLETGQMGHPPKGCPKCPACPGEFVRYYEGG